MLLWRIATVITPPRRQIWRDLISMKLHLEICPMQCNANFSWLYVIYTIQIRFEIIWPNHYSVRIRFEPKMYHLHKPSHNPKAENLVMMKWFTAGFCLNGERNWKARRNNYITLILLLSHDEINACLGASQPCITLNIKWGTRFFFQNDSKEWHKCSVILVKCLSIQNLHLSCK